MFLNIPILMKFGKSFWGIYTLMVLQFTLTLLFNYNAPQKQDSGIRVSFEVWALDNIFIERLWRSVKYEEVYLHDYGTVPVAVKGLGHYFGFYNTERQHQSLDYKTPQEVYMAA